MNIAIYTHRLDFTGAPLMMFRLMRHLAARHRIVLLLPTHDGQNGPLRAQFEAAGIPSVHGINPASFDLLVANTVVAGSVVYKNDNRCPVLWWIHEPDDGVYWLERDIEAREAFKRTTRVVFPTRWQYEAHYKPYVGDVPHAIVPYGIGETPYLGPPPFTRGHPGELRLVHAGWYANRKGQDLVLRALDKLADPDIFCTFMGSMKTQPGFSDTIRRAVANHPILSRTVTLLAEQPPEVAQAWIANADALVFPTRRDLVTLTILEAMMNGTCVLASDFGPIPETVRDGVDGLLSPVGDSDVLAANINRIKEDRDLMRRLGAAGQRRYQELHSFEAHVAAMEEQFHLTAEAKGR